ncbi:Oxoglutarate and iron-dependent oxygenase degradation C-term-domain-containing protein [Phyllosticta citricarpa]|uniref:Oxoglutarate and iron-dependent oxygenase degradation C-term-domain-containing protein n=1 Tax=Phyllosticta citricarpa TaxID=55181 RepID=A0ABR1MPH5_9PEZI
MPSTKRKAEDNASVLGRSKKCALPDEEARSNFREGLFDTKVLNGYKEYYAQSEPYKHAVIRNLIDPSLLRSVRDEIRQNIVFTPKETDIYKIHQSGDLANLDGLDDSSLAKLPSLLRLRDAMYSSAFRKYISEIAGSGPLSGVKTDLAINVYTPGCHLLCHDDVIGSRRVSYILYLLDPDKPWKPEWGGALRLFPTEDLKNEDGEEVKLPQPDPTVVIPPAFNQLSFFTVQPGESFHDVEEVYRRGEGETEEEDGGRVRMAISGWFHIPQKGEEGYEPGLEEKLAEKSSLQQLEAGKADKLDMPQKSWHEYPEQEKEDKGKNKGKGKTQEDEEEEDVELTEADFDFLIKYMTPHYLSPDTVDELKELFEEESSLRLSQFLSRSFSARLKVFLEEADKTPEMPAAESKKKNCGVARPPHKHRFLYRYPERKDAAAQDGEELSPYDELVDVFIPSLAFKKWLSITTSLSLQKSSLLARRFRRGMDYTLATSYEEENPQLEVTLGITPSKGWGDDDADAEEVADAQNGAEADEEEDEEEEDEEEAGSKTNGKTTNGNAKSKPKKKTQKEDEKMPDAPAPAESAEDMPGGYEMYMAADDDDEQDDDDDTGSNDGVEVPAGSKNKGGAESSQTGAGKRRKADPAVYRASSGDDDDGVLFSMPAGWNQMSIVLRDMGSLRFVKYVSKSAKGDRWDVCADYEVEFDEEDDEGNEYEGPESHLACSRECNH